MVLATLLTIGRTKMRWRKELWPIANTSIPTPKKSRKAERSGRTGGGLIGTPTSTFPRAIDSSYFDSGGVECPPKRFSLNHNWYKLKWLVKMEMTFV